MAGWLRRVDDGVYRAERAVVVVLLAAMSVAVFLDVVHRQATSQGRLDAWAERVAGAAAGRWLALGVSFLLFTALGYLALRTAKMARRPSRGASVLLAAAGVAVAYALVKALVLVAPNGLIWAQSFGLCGM